MKTRVIRTIAAALTLSFVLGVVGCSSKDDSEEEPSSSQDAVVNTTTDEDIVPSVSDDGDDVISTSVDEQAEPTNTPSPTPTPTSRDKIEAAVANYFYELLNRYPTSEELDAWATKIEEDQVQTGKPDYNELIDAIVNSDEFNRVDELEWVREEKIGFYVAEIYEGLIGSEIPDDVLEADVAALKNKEKTVADCISEYLQDPNYNFEDRDNLDVVFDIIRVVSPSCVAFTKEQYYITTVENFTKAVDTARGFLDEEEFLAAVEAIAKSTVFDDDIRDRCDELEINSCN